MNEKDHIKELFQSKLSDFRTDIPKDGWEILEKTLVSSSKTHILPRYWYTAAAVVAALILGGIFVFRTPTRTSSVYVTENTFSKPEETISQDAYSKNDNDKFPLPQNDKIVAHATVWSSMRSNTKPKRSSNVKESLEVIWEIEHTGTKPDVTDKHIKNKLSIFDKRVIPIPSHIVNVPEKKHEKQLVQEFIDAGRKAGLHADAALMGKKRKPLALAINNNSGLTSFSKTTNQPMSLRSSKKENIVYTNAVNDANRFQFFPLESSPIPYKVELEHNQPISFGLLLSKNLSHHIFVEAGLMYSYLSAKSKNNSFANSGQERQCIHYIGLPMNINYRLAAFGPLDLYLSLGAILQKDVAGKFSYTVHTNNPNTKSLSEERQVLNIKQKNPQFSLNTGIGLSYPLYSHLKLYGKVGVAYYFDAKNEYNTIYSEQKFALDVNVGLKIDF